jgi:hypothetical protein
MRKTMLANSFALVLSASLALSVLPALANDQPYRFVSEYVRELGAIEELRETADKEQTEATNKMVACVGNSERFQLELSSFERALRDFSFDPPFETLVPNIVHFYGFEIDTWRKLGEACSALLAGEKRGVDYAKVATEVPKLRAQLEYVEKSLFQATPLVFAVLLDQRSDTQNHVNHLTIGTHERDRLVASLRLHFDKKLQEKNPNYTVSSAGVLKHYLSEAGYKCADEPW